MKSTGSIDFNHEGLLSELDNRPPHVFDDGSEEACGGFGECGYCGIASRFIELQGDLIGKALTIIDGAIIDERQNKAVKDIMRGAIYDAVNESRRTTLMIAKNCFGQGK